MAIPRPESARYSSLQEFIGFSKKADNAPSFTNLFSVHFATPPMLMQGASISSGKMQSETGDLSLLLDYYAKSVNLPSKQITTGQTTNVGAAYKYASGTSFSQISMTFQVPRSQQTRTYFERWTQLMANDSNQYTDFYKEYVCPALYIYKWERGGGPEFQIPEYFKKILKALGVDENDLTKYKDDQLVGIYDIRNAFPYNIGSAALTNASASLLTFNVGFYYERYRFFGAAKHDDVGTKYSLSSGQNETDDVTYVVAKEQGKAT